MASFRLPPSHLQQSVPDALKVSSDLGWIAICLPLAGASAIERGFQVDIENEGEVGNRFA
ncbi:hypothetical protein AJ87_03500 [Rhizobium yanglingense]|nr:hypothetical protein AJ87_03500 [Rhizobium yanglingense]